MSSHSNFSIFANIQASNQTENASNFFNNPNLKTNLKTNEDFDDEEFMFGQNNFKNNHDNSGFKWNWIEYKYKADWR